MERTPNAEINFLFVSRASPSVTEGRMNSIVSIGSYYIRGFLSKNYDTFVLFNISYHIFHSKMPEN